MSVNLQKGQKVDLTKGNAGLKKLIVGLGWDTVTKKFNLFGGTKDIDIDASVLLISADTGRIKDTKDVVYFGNLRHKSGAVTHMGDNLTGGSGSGRSDDEQIIIDLSSLPDSYNRLVFVVNIYKAADRRQHFGMVKNAFIRLVNSDDNQELCRYNLSENYDNMTAMIFGDIYLHQGEWKFSAIGEATTDPGLVDLIKRFS